MFLDKKNNSKTLSQFSGHIILNLDLFQRCGVSTISVYLVKKR